jgi:hypothetical protein
VTLEGLVTPAPGGSVDLTKASGQFLVYTSANTTMAAPDYTCPATVAANGFATCSLTLPVDNYTVVLHLPAVQNTYFAAADSGPATVTVYQPATDKYATGGGWVSDPSPSVSPTNNHGNFGFNVRYRDGNPSGQATFAFRGVDGYDYVVKSSSWQNGWLFFGTTTVSFGGTCTLTVIDPGTGKEVPGLGGTAYSFRVDATDNGEPGAGTDTYSIAVYGPDGSPYHQTGSASAQLVLRGGNVAIHTK